MCILAGIIMLAKCVNYHKQIKHNYVPIDAMSLYIMTWNPAKGTLNVLLKSHAEHERSCQVTYKFSNVK